MEKILYPIEVPDLAEKNCPILHFIEIINSKWKLPIIWYLHEKKSTRYNELKRRIPKITNIMLTKSSPPKEILYSLTDLGKSLMPAMNEIYSWSLNQMQIKK